ncbi:uncharacterized protein A1O9_00279 [Exophiala aquamarina CBS 119918]|uniref:DUF1917 domain-containing protein n=1 Tax=Exophiala aquamarina CBS 119918 TaxID=1182545 RepID=A0A072PRF4_9EURO|nr:uncharacterized protein A1O9_00279 [Exophiala aquamarina CBS 119918]KEF62307.1 hypothetical protein A1O9_00279 [Exophiala aquamarina CBS 119918]
MALHQERSMKKEPSSTSATSEELGPIADDLLSEESDFYVSGYNKLADTYNPQKHWEIHGWNAQVNAIKGRKVAKRRARKLEKEETRAKAKTLKLVEQDGHETVRREHGSKQVDTDQMDLDLLLPADEVPKPSEQQKPVNYYEGLPTAKQLSESMNDFLERVPPSTTPRSQGPWIWVANPYPSKGNQPDSGDIGAFKQTGFNLLEEYLARKEEVETKNPGKSPATITRILRPERMKLERAIFVLAKDKHVMDGKWMLFPTPDDVDRVWRIVAQATWGGQLGVAAKVATKSEGQEAPERAAQRLICIYTYDFSDQDDVKRVLLSIRELGLLDNGGDHPGAARPIYYKCDAYTYLDIASGNEFKLKASMYNSRDLLKDG